MPTTQITVSEIHPYEKSSVVKAVTGESFRIKKKDAWTVEQGSTYDIRYEPSEWQGKTTLWIEKAAKVGAKYPGPAPATQPPKAQNGVGFRPPMDPKDGMEARISLICKAYAQAGIVPSAQDVAQLIVNVTEGARLAFMRTTSPQRAKDMDDEIPL